MPSFTGDQRSDDAVIRVTHNNERKEGKFFIPNLTSGLSKLIKKSRMTIIMVLDKDMMQHRRTRTLLNSLSDNTKVYISYFPKYKEQSMKHLFFASHFEAKAFY